jgi:hypothetical protein
MRSGWRALAERRRVFHGPDRYAARAMGRFRGADGSFATSDIDVAIRGVADSVIPDIDESVLTVDGDNGVAVAGIERMLLRRHGRHKPWSEPSLPMELRSYVGRMMRGRDLYACLEYGEDEQGTVTLADTTWLSPETVIPRERNNKVVYEHYVSRRAFEGSGYALSGESREWYTELAEDEVLHLRWPLEQPDPKRAPALAALEVGKEVAEQSGRAMLNSRASVEADETYLPIARARAGDFHDAFDRQKDLSARVKDMLFYPGALEAEVFPWVDPTLDYFAADRILRSRIAICRIRSYLFEQFNQQVVHRLTRLNEWGEVNLRLRPALFGEQDWRDMRSQLVTGDVTVEDARAAVQAEADAGHQFGRMRRD